MNRVAGLDLCDVCVSGHLVPRMRARWGWQLECEQREVSTQRSGIETNNVFVSDLRLKLAHGLPLRIKCRRRKWFHFVFDLAGKTSKVGDEMFDRTVVVFGGPTPMVRMLLASDGAQGAVMNFALGGHFDINGTTITARKVSHDCMDMEGEVMAEVCAIAARLEHLTSSVR